MRFDFDAFEVIYCDGPTKPNPFESEPNRARQKADALTKVPAAAKHLLFRTIAISLSSSFDGGRLLFLLLKSFTANHLPEFGPPPGAEQDPHLYRPCSSDLEMNVPAIVVQQQ